MEGMGGELCLYIDLLSSQNENVKFPGYEV
jgi:hypothetical protein